MPDRDNTLIARHDIAAAVGFMTRLPVPVNAAAAAERGASAAWAWPIAGAVVGTLAGAVFAAAIWLGLPPMAAALLAVSAQIMITGALHEDGLADSADGLWGGWTKERRLEIMRDSRIGSYGVLALILAVGLRVTALAALGDPVSGAVALILSGALSRAFMAAVMASLDTARSDGLSVRTGRPRWASVTLGVGLSTVLGLLLLPFGSLLAATVCSGIAAAMVALLAKAKIGGQTGDILGASQQLSEIAFLICLTAKL